MAKFETLFCAMTWGLVNALVIAIALDAATPLDAAHHDPAASIAGVSTTITA